MLESLKNQIKAARLRRRVSEATIEEIQARKLWFIPVPKTGTQSIRARLRGEFGATFAHEGEIRHHRTASFYRAILGREKWDPLFTFGFTRNPWDRMVSLYRYKNPDLPFKTWLVQKKSDYLERDTFSYFSDYKGKIIVSFIGRFEQLHKDFENIRMRIGMTGEGIPHLNRSRHRPYREYYDDETREIVEKKFCRDIEHFEYRF
jgi:hypothetical protein